MPIYIECRCGTQLEADVAYAGGRLKCPHCGHLTEVPGESTEASGKIRFACPHCSTRVMARVRSAGKPSKCPSCGGVYLVPDQANVPILSTQRIKSRLELIDAADLHSDVRTISLARSFPAPVHPNEAIVAPPPALEVPKELTVIGGGLDGEIIRLKGGRMLVGRERDCEFRLDNQTISRHHCVFKRDGFTLRVRDLGSREGTFINGQRASGEVILQPGDRILLGELTLRVSQPSTAAPFEGRFSVDSNPSINDFVVH